MNKTSIISAIVLFAVCLINQISVAQNTNAYGKAFSPQNAIPFTGVPEKLGSKDSVILQTTGIITEVCQAKGCWMKADIGNGQELMIRFKDYAFFVPKDVVGKLVILHGKAYQETLSVAQLQHYAEDAGKSKKEVASITKPQTSLHFEADGVIIKNQQ